MAAVSYRHPGDGWMDVETPQNRLLYCDVCSNEVRRQMREMAEIEADEPPLWRPARRVVDYFIPEADDRCDRCGVVAAEQHKEEDT